MDLFKIDSLVARGTLGLFAVPGLPQIQERLSLELDIYDYREGRHYVRPVVTFRTNSGNDLKAMLPVDYPLAPASASAAQIFTDSQNGRQYVKVAEGEDIRVELDSTVSFRDQPLSVNNLPSPLLLQGLNIPADQLSQTARAGGGACRSQLSFGGEPYEFQLRVRAAVSYNVVPLNSQERQIRWQQGRYFANDPKIGNISLDYNPNFASRTKMIGGAEQFFPASGANEMFFTMNLHDLGLVAMNLEPMMFSFSQLQWPPYAEPQKIDAPVMFYIDGDPARPLLNILENELQIYDYNSIDVECEAFSKSSAEEDLFDGRWMVRNPSASPIRCKWFVVGDCLNRPEGNVLLSPQGTPGSSIVIETSVLVERAETMRSISFAVVSLDEPVLTGAVATEISAP